MFDFLLDGGLLLSLVGLWMALSANVRSQPYPTDTFVASDAPVAPDVYGQQLVETYMGYRQ